MESKVCTKCNFIKSLDEFHVRRESKDGFRNDCKICVCDRQKIYNKNNCDKIKENNAIWYRNNKEKTIIDSLIWSKNNPNKVKTAKIKWAKNNSDKIKEKNRKYEENNKHRRAYRLVIKNSLNRLGKKKEGKTIDLLGYSALDLKNHITNLFTDGMSWDNYGEWHIDHIKRVREFNKDTPMDIVNALTNLRPLWSTTREINGIIYEGNLNRG